MLRHGSGMRGLKAHVGATSGHMVFRHVRFAEVAGVAPPADHPEGYMDGEALEGPNW